MTSYSLIEWQRSEPLHASADVRRLMESQFEARVTAATSDLVVITPGGVVGTARVGDDVVVVAPKLTVDRVLFMVAYANDPYRWRHDWGAVGQTDDLVEGMAALFLRACRQLVAEGLLRSYRRVERDAPYVKGRIRWDRQARRHAPVPIAIRHDVHDDDIVENQILRAAAEVLRRGALGERSTYDVSRFWRLVEHTSTLRDPLAALDRMTWTRHNEHYRPVLGLARVILSGAMTDLVGGTQTVTGFTLVLHDVFESFVRRALQEVSGHRADDFPDSWSGRGLSLAEGGGLALKPDLGVRSHGQWLFVGDVKYKTDDGPAHAHDAYQALAYAVATGLPDATLIYARGPGEPGTHVVRRLGVRLRIRHLDLARPPDHVLGQLNEIARGFPAAVAVPLTGSRGVLDQQ